MADKPELPPRPAPKASLSDFSDTPLEAGRPRKDTVHLTPYRQSLDSTIQRPHPYIGGFDDPRSSSTQSLHPVESADSTRRTLLIIYIHGFLGDETSFKSFPAHVHNLLSAALSETHVVYSKIYPRYKSRNNISVARDNFSSWLTPHESPTTDVVLVGHSLGGILGAEVILIPSSEGNGFRHRVLGLVAVDVPFLGMHPGVVGTGIASLFRAAPTETQEPVPANASLSDMSDSSSADPHFNPSYTNDIHLATRQGKFERGWYFFNKHWGELTKATRSYVSSHLEFGGCLADYPGLKRRYDAIRALEDIDDFAGLQNPGSGNKRRVRFVNYYSASTGRIKERAKSRSPQREQLLTPDSAGKPPSLHNDQSPLTSSTASPARSVSPRISLEVHQDGQIIPKQIVEPEEEYAESSSGSPASDLQVLDPMPELNQHNSGQALAREPSFESQLPPLPPIPEPPPPFDASQYSDKDTMKVAQRDHARKVKQWGRARRDRERSIRDREKLIAKREKQAQKELEKQAEKQAEKQFDKTIETKPEKQIEEQTVNQSENPPGKMSEQAIEAKGVEHGAVTQVDTQSQQMEDMELSRKLSTLDTASSGERLGVEKAERPSTTKQKDRKFCVIPNKDTKTGQRDPTWVRVYMEGVDEVVAHTSMFKPSESYALLVGDTVARIEGWVKDDATRRAILSAQDVD